MPEHSRRARPRAAVAHKIVVKALDRQGRTLEIEAEDFPARVIQHETDHLDGVLFFDRMKSLTSLTYLDEYSRYHAKDERRLTRPPAPRRGARHARSRHAQPACC